MMLFFVRLIVAWSVVAKENSVVGGVFVSTCHGLQSVVQGVAEHKIRVCSSGLVPCFGMAGWEKASRRGWADGEVRRYCIGGS